MGIVLHHHFIDKLAFFNGLISGIALYPQVWVVLTTGSTTGISVISFTLIFLNSGVWLIYSIHRLLISLAVASVLNMLASGILIFTILFN